MKEEGHGILASGPLSFSFAPQRNLSKRKRLPHNLVWRYQTQHRITDVIIPAKTREDPEWRLVKLPGGKKSPEGTRENRVMQEGPNSHLISRKAMNFLWLCGWYSLAWSSSFLFLPPFSGAFFFFLLFASGFCGSYDESSVMTHDDKKKKRRANVFHIPYPTLQCSHHVMIIITC